MTQKFAETIKVLASTANADDHTSATVSPYVAVTNVRHLVGVAGGAALASGKIQTVALLQATDTSGTGSKALGASVSGAANIAQAVAEADVSDMDTANGFLFVAVSVSSNNAASHAAGGVLLGTSGRYSN